MKSQSKKHKIKRLASKFMALPLLASTILSGIPASKAEAGMFDALGSMRDAVASRAHSVASAALPAAVMSLINDGVPAWGTESRLAKASAFAGSMAASMATSHLMNKGAMFAIGTWAPGLLVPTVLGLPVAAVAVPLMVGLVASGGIKKIVAFSKEHPKTAVALGAAAILGAYFGGHHIKNVLAQLGDSSLAVKKAIIDHGSGSVKMSIATMNPFTDTVIGDTVDVAGIELTKMAVEMSKTMRTVNGVLQLDSATMSKGIDTVAAMVEYAKAQGVSPQHISAVATEWARTGAANIPAYIEQMREATGVSLIVAQQVDEAQLGVMAIDAALKAASPSSSGLAIGDRVLDAGGGSAQFSVVRGANVAASGAIDAVGTAKASGAMGKYAAEVVEGMRGAELSHAGWSKRALEHLSGMSKAWTQSDHSMKTVPFEEIQAAMQGAGHSTYALGNVFGSSKSLAEEVLGQCYTTLSTAQLDRAMEALNFKSAEEVAEMVAAAGMPPAITSSLVANIPLVRGMMDALGVAEVQVLKANSGMAAFTLPKFWQSAAGAYSEAVRNTTAGLFHVANAATSPFGGAKAKSESKRPKNQSEKAAD